MKSFGPYVILLLSLVILTGCFNGSPEEKIHKILEKTAEKENNFTEHQEPLNDLEKKEKEKYEKIIELGLDEYEQIVEISDEATKNIDQREEIIEKEQSSMQSSKEQFNKIGEQIGKIEDEKVKKEAADLKKIMSERYSTYDNLYDAYQQSLAYDRELYELFKKEDLKMDELQGQIEKINTSYAKVLKANEQFNALTEKSNQKKESFYDSSGIEMADSTK
ncbi:YkyA family protein [Peribacillus sp. ACCC06369]|uniref:YkyA family protein n=1 Tax=unclassified Peribacillus TaxID=2675266 RepID=UPI0025A308FC|nr:YkyA family protein [Peribacillus sp. ACCC06369]MDM5357851.1 YkyA family protein [Peribacillus sp. ACCC06369]